MPLGRPAHGTRGRQGHPGGGRENGQLLRYPRTRRPRGAHPQSLRRLVNIVNAKEDLLTQALGITPERRHRWCAPVAPAFLEAVNRTKPDSFERLAQLWYRHSGGSSPDWRECAATHYDRSRYHLLNLHATFSTERPAHTIEFRAFNGTLDPAKILAYIQLCLAIKRAGLAQQGGQPDPPGHGQPQVRIPGAGS